MASPGKLAALYTRIDEDTMKHTYKKALIACALTTVFSLHAMAEEPVQQATATFAAPVGAPAPAPAAAPAPVAAASITAEEETPASLYSNLNPEQAAEISQSKAVTKSLDDLNRRKDKSEVELAIIKLEVDKEKARDEIRKLKGQVTASETAAAQKTAEVSAPSDVSAPKSKGAVPTSPLERVFVTQIYGLEGSEVATVFYENSIIKAHSGDNIADGLRLEKVLSNGAIFSYKGKIKKSLLTTKEQAFSRSFSSGKEDEGDHNRQQQMPRMAMPMNPTSGN